MSLAESKSWSNFSYGYRNDVPNGWLLNPERTRIILFELSKRSSASPIKILTHTYYTNSFGEPVKIKSSSQMSLDDAWNKWHDLQLKDWTFEEYELP
tara:strand:- start:147 stop:437 length:291 start_codon:yes stop_codon:yes gene_type:complete